MKKLLSVLLSAMLCASILVANPGMIDVPDNGQDDDTTIEVEYGAGEPGEENVVEPLDDGTPPFGGDGL